MARFEVLRESRAVRLGMAEDALDYEDLVRVTHVDSNCDVLTLEEEAHVVEVEHELVGMASDTLEEHSTTDWAQVASEAAVTASRHVHRMQLGDNILKKWAFMVGNDIHDEARLELEFLERGFSRHAPSIVEAVRPYLDLDDHESREVVVQVLWWVNMVVLVLAWYHVALLVRTALCLVMGVHRRKDTTRNQPRV